MEYRLKMLAIGMTASFAAVGQHFVDTSAMMDRLDSLSAPSARARQEVYCANPATHGLVQQFSLTDASVGYEAVRRGDNAAMTWQGKGGHTIHAGVESFMKLNKRLAVWGGAAYESGMTRSVVWNSVVDYTRVAPYALADSIGGRVTMQRYMFNGGVSTALGRWNIGAEASYRAEIDYRGRDPRIKDVVSDLDISLGASVNLEAGWTLGLSGRLTIYNQDGDVEFYNPINNIRTHLLTGLGTTYQRFSGGGTETTAYEGLGTFGSLQIIKRSARGAGLTVSGGKENIKQRLRDYNNLDLTSADTYRLGANMFYQLPRVVTIVVDGEWTRRIGRENLFGSAVGNTYPLISSRENYYADYVTGTLSVPVELRPADRWQLDIVPAGRFSYLRQFLRQPNRLFTYNYLTPSLQARCVWRSSDACRWTLMVRGERTMAHTVSYRPGTLDGDTDLGAATLGNQAILGADVVGVSGELRCDFALPHTPLFYISASCDREHLMHRGDADRYGWMMHIGASF